MAKKTVEKEVVKFVDYGKTLDAAIIAVKKDGQKLKHKIHNVGLSIIQAWGKKQIEGKQAAGYFTALGEAAGYHGKPLAQWVKLKTPLLWSDEAKAWYAPPDAKVNGITFTEARDEPFWEVSPPPQPKPFDAINLLESLIGKNMERMAKPEKRMEGDKLIPTDVVNLLRDALAKAKAETTPEPSH